MFCLVKQQAHVGQRRSNRATLGLCSRPMFAIHRRASAYLLQVAGIRSYFPASTVTDVASADQMQLHFSSHYDKNIRFWDFRSEKPAGSLRLDGKITSMCVSPGKFRVDRRDVAHQKCCVQILDGAKVLCRWVKHINLKMKSYFRFL